MRITPRHHYLLLLVSFFSLSSNAQLTVNGYTNHTIAGFDVLVEDAAMTTDSVKTNAAISLLQTKLNEILQFNIDQVKKDSLLAVPIFMDWNTTTVTAQYHPSRTWLINNGFAP